MIINSSHAGTVLKEHSALISPGALMYYAASIGDMNPRYFDDESPEGIIAHPLFCAAVTWPVLENIRGYITEENFPSELLTRQVHYTEYLEFRRPLCPGDSLQIKGRIISIMPHRAGAVVTLRFDAFEKGEALPVFTEIIGGMMRGVQCEGGGRGAEELPDIPGSGGGAVLWSRDLEIPEYMPWVYEGCSGIRFPIHTSRKFARFVGLPGPILQGTAALALAVSEIIGRDCGGDPGRLRRLYCRFTGMILPGTKISINRYSSESGGEGKIFFSVINSAGESALSRGFAEIRP